MHVAYEAGMLKHFSGHPLGTSILGTLDSVGALTAEQMQQYHADHYRAGNITLAIAGNFDFDQIVELAKQHCDHWPSGTLDRPIHEAKPQRGVSVVTQESRNQQNIIQMTSFVTPPRFFRSSSATMAEAGSIGSLLIQGSLSSPSLATTTTTAAVLT